MKYVKKIIQAMRCFDYEYFKKTSLLTFIYSAYLTLRYIDVFHVFPTFQFKDKMRIDIDKKNTSLFSTKGRIIVEPWFGKKNRSFITLNHNSNLIMNNDFIIGDGVKFYIDTNARLVIHGKNKESASGITASSTVMVKESVEIGEDSIIAWNTFITDCDWHGVENKKSTHPTKIGSHTWLGVGSIILKNVTLGTNTIVTSNSVVLSGKYENQVMLSGNPAQIVNKNIPNWKREVNL